jgi:hypothetical protein
MDFAALASRMAAGLDGVRACLIVSGDGFSLGAYPDHAEPAARSVWERLSAVGDPQRGFLHVGDELWVVARRGWYGALLIASAQVKPGLALDRLEAYLRTAEEARVRETSELTGAHSSIPEVSRRLRTPLHREVRPAAPPSAESAQQPPAPPVEPEPRPGPEPAAEPPQTSVPAQIAPPVETVDTSPAPKPPPVARPEPENEAPRPHAAAAAPDHWTPPPATEPAPEAAPRAEADRAEAVRTEGPPAQVVHSEPTAGAVEEPSPRGAEQEPERPSEPPRAEVVLDMTRADVLRPSPAAPAPVERPVTAEPVLEPAPPAPDREEVKDDSEKTEVDRVALTREFSQLFGDDGGK